jgi:hypothetical protein
MRPDVLPDAPSGRLECVRQCQAFARAKDFLQQKIVMVNIMHDSRKKY